MQSKELNCYYQTLIIGAGPAGLAAAMELSETGKDFCVIEKSDQVGGLAKTYVIWEGDLEFRTDNGPHRFFSKNQYLYDFIGSILGEHWIAVERHTQQYVDGVFLDYPVNVIQVLRSFSPFFVCRIFIDYLWAVVQYKVFRKKMLNFYDYAVANFGKTLADFNILGYTEKIWGIPSPDIHADWAKQRITGLNIRSLIKNLIEKNLFGKGKGIKTLVDEFYYPDSGSGLVYEAIKGKLEVRGYSIFTLSQPVTVFHDGRRIKKVSLEIGDKTQEVEVENLIESVHVVDFLKLLNPLPPEEVLAAARRLKYRSQVYLFVTLNKERVSQNQWIYFPDKQIPFARISEMKNFSPKMAPPGKTSLFIEFFCNEGDEIYQKTKEELFELAMPYLEGKFFSRAEVRHYYLFRGSKDYPLYNLNYEKNLAVIKDYLDSFENLYYIGRPGRFKYTNQDHSLEMGILAAKGVMDGKKIDMDDIGAEQEYFEKGYHKNKK